MIKSQQLSPGMTISLKKKVYRIESAVKVSLARGVPFIKTKMKDLINDEIIEKNFKIDQEIDEVKLLERRLEYLYLEGQSHVFFDIETLDQIPVSHSVIDDKVNFLKEGMLIKAMFYGDSIFSVELPQFLEIMIIKTEDPDKKAAISGTNKMAVLETGARIEVPMFVESGDVIKVDTSTNEYIQRV